MLDRWQRNNIAWPISAENSSGSFSGRSCWRSASHPLASPERLGGVKLSVSCRVFGESHRHRGVGSNAHSGPFCGQVNLPSPRTSRARNFKRYFLEPRQPSRSHLQGRLQGGPASLRTAAVFRMPRWSMSEASPARASIGRWSICALRSLKASASRHWTRPSGWAASATSDYVITRRTRPPDR